MLGRDEEGRKNVQSVLDNAASRYSRAKALQYAEAARDESTVDKSDASASKRRGLPEPPAWWNDDNASRDSLVAARQLSGIKSKVKN